MPGKERSFHDVLQALGARFPSDLLDVSAREGMLSVLKIRPGAVVPVMTFLRDEGTFEHCALVTAVDWRDRFEILYHLWSDEWRGYLELSADVPAEDPHIDSVSGVWYGANWHEREAWDLLGVRFDGHPDLRRLLMPEGYRFHPLRKSFELHEPEELEVKARHV